MTRFIMRTGLAVLATSLLSTAAEAALFRAYLSSTGNDANPCTVQQPCRLLPAALTAVADNGEIWMLDSANYNTDRVFVNKSVTIMAVPGQVGSIISIGTGNAAMLISAAGAKVTLRNLSFGSVATQPGTDGIGINSASAVTIEDCQFANLPGEAFRQLDQDSTTHVRNSVFRNNGVAFDIAGGNGVVETSQFFNNTEAILGQPIFSGQFANIVVSDSLISGAGQGIHAHGQVANAAVKIAVSRSTITGAGFGLNAATEVSGSTLITISGTTITNNTNAFVISTPLATIKSLGNNHIVDNGNDGTGLTTVTLR